MPFSQLPQTALPISTLHSPQSLPVKVALLSKWKGVPGPADVWGVEGRMGECSAGQVLNWQEGLKWVNHQSWLGIL